MRFEVLRAVTIYSEMLVPMQQATRRQASDINSVQNIYIFSQHRHLGSVAPLCGSEPEDGHTQAVP